MPASQEAEPLDITVTLHQRAAQAKLPPQAQPWSPSPLALGHSKLGACSNGSPASTFASPSRLLDPPSPSSVRSASPAASPSFGARKGSRPKTVTGARICDQPIASVGESGVGVGGWDGAGGGASEARHQLSQGRETWAALYGSRGGKRRGRLKIRGGGKSRLRRAGSATGGRVTPSTPPVPDMRQIASWDGTQDMSALVPTDLPWPEQKGGAVASSTAERGAGLVDAGTSGREGGEGGGGLFSSFARRRSGQADARGHQREGGTLSSKPQGGVPPALSARESGAGVKGGKAEEMRGGLRSAPAAVAAAPASYKMFFGDTDDGGDESGSSDDEDGGGLPRKSFIRVDCAARTSYKLFSSDPQVSDWMKGKYKWLADSADVGSIVAVLWLPYMSLNPR